MLKRATRWTALLVAIFLGGCDATREADGAEPSEHTEVIFEVPEGSGPEPVATKGEEEDCTTSCSLKNHPIPPFDELDFEMAMDAYAKAAPDADSEGLETLLFHGPRTKYFLGKFGHRELSDAHKANLARELSRSEAKVSLRLVDEQDQSIRAVYGPSPVPIGQKQHLATVGDGLLAMEFNGTVMRTGVNYLWSRY